MRPTTSFATSGYNGLHAFGLVDADGNEHWGRYQWHPLEGEHYLSDDEREAADRDYLQHEIRERLGSGGKAEFRLDFVLAAEGDSLTDPTEEWKGENEVVTLGTLTVTDVIEEPSDGPLVFDPNNLTDGIVALGRQDPRRPLPRLLGLDRAPDGVTTGTRLAKERACTSDH